MTAQPGFDTANAPPAARGSLLGRAVRWTLIAVACLAAVLLLTVTALFVFSPTIDLSPARDWVRNTASTALDRPLTIDGPLVLLPSLNPSIQIERVSLGNPSGWPPSDLAQVGLARVQFAIAPLLRGELVIDELVLEGLTLQLETKASGESNWNLQSMEREKQADTATFRLTELKRLVLRDLDISYTYATRASTTAIAFSEVSVAAERQTPLRLSVLGKLGLMPLQATLTGGTLDALLSDDQPWPLQLDLAAADATLKANGSVAKPLLGEGFAVDIDLVIPLNGTVAALSGTSAPLDKLTLLGHLSDTGGQYRLEQLSASVGDTRMSGNLMADLSGPVPRLTGDLHAPRIDAQPFFDAAEQPDKAAPTPSDRAWKHDNPILSIAPFEAFDADLTVDIDSISGGPASLRDVSLVLKVSDGKVTAPLAVTLAGVPLSGRATLNAAEGIPEIGLSLTARGQDIGELDELLLDASGIEGRFEYAKLKLSARGASPRALAETAALQFALSNASLSYGHDDDEDATPVSFTLHRLNMDFPAERESRIDADGTLLGEPFALNLSGGPFLEKFVADYWSFKLTASGGGAFLKASALVTPGDETRVGISLSGERIGTLAPWLGVAPDATASYQLDGEVVVSDAAVQFTVTKGMLDKTRFSGEIGVATLPEEGAPVTLLKLDADAVDWARLAALLPKSSEKPVDNPKIAIDIPILPKDIEIADSDIAISIDRLKTRFLDLRRLSTSSRIRGGYVQKAPFQALVADAPMKGSLSVDLRTAPPRVGLDLNSRSLDVGRLLSQMRVVDGLDLTARRVKLSAALEGVSAREMLNRSTITARVKGGLWRVHDTGLAGSLDISIVDAKLSARGRRPTALTINGAIDRSGEPIPLSIALKTDSLATLARPKKSLGIDADIRLAKADAKLNGEVRLPVRGTSLQLDLALKGTQLSDLNPLFALSLPPWGPYSLSGRFQTSSSGYYVRGLRTSVGNSNLGGDLEFRTAGKKPRLVADLSADKLQLHDFKTGDWSAERPPSAAGTSRLRAAASRIRALLTPEVMRSLDAALSVKVKQVSSGRDRLGSGRLKATLKQGRLAVEPLRVDTPGGTVNIGFTLKPTASDIALSATTRSERFDYGYVARYIDTRSKVIGRIAVDADINTRGSDLDHVMQNAGGHIKLAIWPRGIDAGIFDLWATNLLVHALPLIDASADSKINCLVAGFELENGLMRPTALLVDTTRVQASGTGVIDFQARNVNLRVEARPKRAQMFSAATPLRIQGDFSDFSAGLHPGSVLATTLRVVTSPVVVPFQWLFGDRPARDGKAACKAAWKEINGN